MSLADEDFLGEFGTEGGCCNTVVAPGPSCCGSDCYCIGQKCGGCTCYTHCVGRCPCDKNTLSGFNYWIEFTDKDTLVHYSCCCTEKRVGGAGTAPRANEMAR
ncbi:hypothetical protein AB1Y20_017322 [Prymnesium parvum]|uniref:Phospholipid scramblase n=1 Tax=Prymnesium parvum TaxID=97485 RepID=A0AB34JJV6_PRYPA